MSIIVYIDYLGTDTKKISELNLGCSLKTKHENKDYDNLFGMVFQIFS